MTDSIADWLRAQLEIDAQIALDAAHYEAGNWTTQDGYPVSVADELPKQADIYERVVVFDEGSPSEEQARHIAEWDPARVLREIDAKRQILALHDDQHDCADPRGGDWPYSGCQTLRLLALPYSDRPGYKEEWRP